MRDFTNEIDKSLDVLFKGEEKQGKKKQLIDKAKTVYLQVMLFRIPYTSPRKRKFVKLRHSLHGDDPEICLFVPNRKTGVEYKKTTDELIDFCVDYYTDLLEKHKVKGISTVMPFKQLRSEYGSYEMRRKLVRRFDLFLCKNSLLHNANFITSLGKSFKVANKMPLGVPFPKEKANFNPKFQKNIENAILMSPFYISRFSDNYSIPVGRVSNTKKELKENLQVVLEQLLENDIIPGGFQNIRALYVWPSQSKSIPLYICTELPVDMKTPREKCKRKRIRGVAGEISTLPHKEVCVMPNGEVFVTNKRKEGKIVEEIESESDDSFKDDSDDEDDEKKENVKAAIKSMGEEEEESESEDDEEIERKEARLMEEKRQAEEEEDEEDDREESDADGEPQRNVKKEEKNGMSSRKQKLKRKNTSEGDETSVAKKKKSGKAEQKVNKAKRKMMMKQKKFNLNEKVNQKKKSQQKKV